MFVTGLLSIFRDLHLDIKTSNRNRVNNWTLDIGHFYGKDRVGRNPVKRSRGHTFPILGARETLHVCRKAPWGSKRKEHHPIIGDAKAVP